MHDQFKAGPVKIIARHIDGRIIKGWTTDFFPNKPFFHVYGSALESASEGIKVLTGELKAVFFVKDFEGNPSYDERKRFEEGQKVHGRKIEVTFKDDEKLVGTTTGYDPKREGFFLFPADAGSNNLRVYVISKSIKKVSTFNG